MVHINYVKDTDELEVIFDDQIEVPEVFKCTNGVIFEFGQDNLSAIILPNFGKMVHIPELEYTSMEFESFNSELLKIKINEQTISIKVSLDELENS